MAGVISINPVLTSNAAGSFNVETTGFIQGTMLDDPAIRNALAGGVLAATETLPMWGGVGISELIPTPSANYVGSTATPAGVLGTVVSRALSLTAQATGQLTGFSVFNQAHNMINSPQSPVPLAGTGMGVNFFRLKSGARIALAIDPALVTLEGQLITSLVSWDFVNQRIIEYIAAYASEAVASATYTSATGVLALTFSSAPFGAGIGSGANGTYISVNGFTGTGNAPLNGDWPILSTASSGTVINVQAPIGLGSITVAGGTLQAGGGALPVNILDINVGNSMTVSYDSTTGFATWNRSGSTAIVQI